MELSVVKRREGKQRIVSKEEERERERQTDKRGLLDSRGQGEKVPPCLSEFEQVQN